MRMIDNRIAQKIRMRQHGQPTLRVNAANGLVWRKTIGNNLLNAEREYVPGGGLDLLPDDDDELRQTFAKKMRERHVVKVRDRNAAELALMENAPQLS